MKKALFSLLFASAAALAQNYEIGGGFGGSFYSSREITNSTGKVDAGFKAGPSGSFWATQNTSDQFGGEIRYTYTRGSARLDGTGGNAEFSAEAHAIGYDVLYYFKDRRQKVRPYVLVGAGAKIFRGTGQERSSQPLSSFGFLTKTTQPTVFINFGGGIKYQLSEKLSFRVEVRDVTSPFPSEVIATAPSAKASGGWIHNIVPTFGISYLF